MEAQFERKNWIVKRATETLEADIIWYQCTKCAIRLKIIPYLENRCGAADGWGLGRDLRGHVVFEIPTKRKKLNSTRKKSQYKHHKFLQFKFELHGSTQKAQPNKFRTKKTIINKMDLLYKDSHSLKAFIILILVCIKMQIKYFIRSSNEQTTCLIKSIQTARRCFHHLKYSLLVNITNNHSVLWVFDRGFF
ncbi:hypothetical protein BpHYR1_021729 [Brachionus plicatilis]|uniref:Uncharacterized protein n=1 Tax=Brachionus plicatilis TaxID=10195 RepID=A0A3M7PXY2_BRAPC|nr:hypothetical protein BpHYR1_021729 [Brachionus plicatilis]